MGRFYFYGMCAELSSAHESNITVQYTFAIRQAPHPLRSVCSVKAQTRLRLACSLCSMYVLKGRTCSSKAHSTFILNFVFGAEEHNDNSTKYCKLRQPVACTTRLFLPLLMVMFWLEDAQSPTNQIDNQNQEGGERSDGWKYPRLIGRKRQQYIHT